MRQPLKTNMSFAVLMSLSIGLGACAAHKRESVDAIRADRDQKAGKKTQAPEVVDLKSLISLDNKGTYQLNTYDLAIVKGADQAPVAGAPLAASPLKTGDAAATAKTPIQMTINDKSISDVLAKIPSVVNEFSAVDGSLVSSRTDVLSVEDNAVEDSVTITTGKGNVTDEASFNAQPVVLKLEDGSIEIDRTVLLDEATGLATKERMVYLQNSENKVTDSQVKAAVQAITDVKPKAPAKTVTPAVVKSKTKTVTNLKTTTNTVKK